MKTASLFIALVAFSLYSHAHSYEATAPSYPTVASSLIDPEDEDSTAHQVERKIEDALNEALDHQDFARLSKLEEELGNTDYWKAYLAFQEAIYFLENEEEKESARFVKRGIQLIEEVAHPSSEDYALLAMMQGFSIQFAEFAKTPALAKKMKDNAKKSIELDGKNPRGYYVYAIQDYYTPAEYGGGKEAEAYLKKAVAILTSTDEPTHGPNWGEDSSFELLINFHLRKNEYDAAKKLYEKAIAIYPDSYIVENLKSKF